ncbi:DMT family transporter [Caenispirillum salinarum]|uniref:DMT family transporter n=1 Tax=Caenispirillum salinarum TaxID=859058 RepID=UPI00384FDF6F
MSSSQTSPTATKTVHWWASPYLMLVMPPLFWAGNAVVGRVAVADISPLALSVVRWSLAILILLPFTASAVLNQWPVVRAKWKSIAVLGILSAGLYNLFLYMALETTTAINVTLLNTSMPMTIVLVSWIWLRERPSAGGIAGILLSMMGVLVVVGRGDPSVLMGLEVHAGDGLMLLAVLVWSLYSVGLRAHPPGLTAGAMLTVQMMAGLCFLAPLYAVEAATVGSSIPMTWGMALVFLYVATGPSIGAFYFWNRGVAEAGASTAGLYINLLPVFTAILAVIFLGESLYWFHGAGLVLIFSGILLGTLGARRRRRARGN